MRSLSSRRFRKRSSSPKTNTFFKKGNGQEPSFFGSSARETFFQPNGFIQRKCENCEEEDKQVNRMPGNMEGEKLQRMGDEKEKREEGNLVQAKESNANSSAAVSNTSNYISNISNGGAALPKSVQMFFANRMGHDFKEVKIHTGKEAEQSAKNINAQAYTFRNHIVFGEGKYQPDTVSGKTLLAHELAHVIQQKEAAGEQMQRKVSYSLPKYHKEDPIPKIIGAGGKLGETFITINGVKLVTKHDAMKAVFEAFNNNLSLTHDASKKICKPDTSALNIDVGAEITLVTDPVNDKWSGNYAGSLVTGSAYCSKLPLVNIDMLSSPSGGEALKKSVSKDEAQHFTDIVDLSEKHIEAYHAFLDGLSIPAEKVDECPAKFTAAIGNKDLTMATAFADDWLAAVYKYDKPTGSHHYKSITDARNCSQITVTVNF